MPTYHYRCKNCGFEFEEFESITARPRHTCPKCGGGVERLLSPVGLIFKGSGFYITDYGYKSKIKDKDEGSKESKDSNPKKD